MQEEWTRHQAAAVPFQRCPQRRAQSRMARCTRELPLDHESRSEDAHRDPELSAARESHPRIKRNYLCGDPQGSRCFREPNTRATLEGPKLNDCPFASVCRCRTQTVIEMTSRIGVTSGI